MIKITKTLTTTASLDAYTDAGASRKMAYHKEGKTFLRALAKELGLEAGTYDVRSNLGGIAVSGEVTLHADHLYVQLHASWFGSGVAVLYRSCTSRKDYTGGTNHSVTMDELAHAEKQAVFVSKCKQLLQQEAYAPN